MRCFLALPHEVLASHILPYRDLTKVLLQLTSIGLLCGRRNGGRLLLSGFLLGYATWIKSDALFILPAALLTLHVWLSESEKRLKRRSYAWLISGVLLGVLPMFVQTGHDFGHIFQLPQLNLLLQAGGAGPEGDFEISRIGANLDDYVSSVVIRGLGAWIIFLIPGVVQGLENASAMVLVLCEPRAVSFIGKCFWALELDSIPIADFSWPAPLYWVGGGVGGCSMHQVSCKPLFSAL